MPVAGMTPLPQGGREQMEPAPDRPRPWTLQGAFPPVPRLALSATQRPQAALNGSFLHKIVLVLRSPRLDDQVL
jgi:hypothetical protein